MQSHGGLSVSAFILVVVTGLVLTLIGSQWCASLANVPRAGSLDRGKIEENP